MGSFNVTCSITNRTIQYGQPVVCIFMIPSQWAHMSGKKLINSHTPALSAWTPFGPAIRGTYDDYGTVLPNPGQEDLISILERLTMVSFDELHDHATTQYDTNATVKSELLREITMTYLHRGAYDILTNENFCAELGTRDDLDQEVFNGMMERAEDGLFGSLTWQTSVINSPNTPFRGGDSLMYPVLRYLKDNHTEMPRWYREQLTFLYSLKDMSIELRASNYGGQQNNWVGFRLINENCELLEEEYKSLE